ncbi:MAG: M1 family metallopeptidase [Halieaceae bacterium]|nr:M1 family metallopeptidase [Halieaceae bacterium]
MRLLCTLAITGLVGCNIAWADAVRQTKGEFYDAFRQLDVDLPTANVYRTASGAPGPRYWQQRADYKIEVVLDEQNRRIDASESIIYVNNSPDSLRYLWLQLDQNRFADQSLDRLSETAASSPERHHGAEAKSDLLTFDNIARHQLAKDIDYGFRINRVVDVRDHAIPHTIVDTMMRVDLAKPLEPGETTTFSVDWSFNIVDEPRVDSRGGYEHFIDNDTYIYFLAQWFPRLAAYTDYAGWQNKAFINSGEFTLEFGDYEVAITVPDDHIVSATGELQNASEVLSGQQQRRLSTARESNKPLFIVTPDEARRNEKGKSSGSRTWKFRASNVRDFAWASSRKFIWDAMVHRQDSAQTPEVMAMSFYPPEAEPIWSKYSTHAVVHTMQVYSRFSFDYPYPTSQSVNTWKSGGMEYPMMTFNGYRPELFEPENEEEEKDAPQNTYSRSVKYGLIGVVIHEVGHNYFPMIVNSDERQWTWMDEGLNSFLEYLAELEWEEEFPAYGDLVNVLDYIGEYMVSENQVPVMTNSESILQFSPNAYTKPTAALIVLRETVMGRELFDFAFKEYARRWMFKRPTPADFFRTMEDASGIDLDWFWRGWFFSTDHVDIALNAVREYKVSSTNPDIESDLTRSESTEKLPETLTQIRNRKAGGKTYIEKHPELSDFYNDNDRFTVSNEDRNNYSEDLDNLEEWEYKSLIRAVEDNDFIYFMDFENIGGLPSSLPLGITYADGVIEQLMLPPEIWRRGYRHMTKLLIRDKAIESIALDPRHETADVDYSNNYFPARLEKSRIELYKEEDETRNLMSDMLRSLRQRKGSSGDSVRSVPLRAAN